jgi:hypothetical protein
MLQARRLRRADAKRTGEDHEVTQADRTVSVYVRAADQQRRIRATTNLQVGNLAYTIVAEAQDRAAETEGRATAPIRRTFRIDVREIRALFLANTDRVGIDVRELEPQAVETNQRSEAIVCVDADLPIGL